MIKPILALDIGRVRVGVAISDKLRMFAHPFKTIQWKNQGDFLNQIKHIIQAEAIGHLVLGIPYTLKGTNSQQTDHVLKLYDIIVQELDVPVSKMDERLTTKLATQQLHAAGKKASRHRDIIDQVAAVNILQSYLDKMKNIDDRKNI